MSNKVCIKDSIKQIDSFWTLRTQLFIPENIYGIYFDDNDNLLIDKNLVTNKYTLSNSHSSNNFVVIADQP